MRHREVAAVLTSGDANVAERRLLKILDFFGVQYIQVDLQKASRDFSGPGQLVPIVSGTAINSFVAAGAPNLGSVRHFFSQAPARLVWGISPESAAPLKELLDIATHTHWVEPTADDVCSIGPTAREVTGALTGQAFRTKQWPQRSAAFAKKNVDYDLLIALNDHPMFVRHRAAGTDTFLLGCDDVADLDEVVFKNLDVRTHFLDLFPYVMFLRHAFPTSAWRPAEPRGVLIVDDPPLRWRYGFLDLARLTHAVDTRRLSVNLAFIPWNYRRTDPSVAHFIAQRPERLGISIHGCDHTGSEYGTSDPERLAALSALALERMEALRQRQGIPYEPIMVFPQGVFSEAAMEVLQSFNFLAAVNTEIIPSHTTKHVSSVTLGDIIAPAIMRYGGLALFPRRKCSDHIANFAADIFLGRPVLLVTHHTDFVDGDRAVLDLMGAIGATAANLTWSSLGTVLRSSCLRRASGDKQFIYMFANELGVSLDASSQAVEVIKREPRAEGIRGVKINGEDAEYHWNDGILTIPITTGPATTVTLLHRNGVGRQRAFGPSYRVRAAMRRYLCEVRDNYVDPGRRIAHRLLP